MLMRFSQIFLAFLFLKQSHTSKLLKTYDFQLFDDLVNVTSKLSNQECRQQLLSMRNAYTRGEMWALKMFDATAKPQAGVLLGNIVHVGNYDECLGIDEELLDTGTRIHGQYCTVVIRPHPKHGQFLSEWLSELLGGMTGNDGDDKIILDARLSFGICVPKICTVENLQILADTIENALQPPFHLNFVEEFCDGGDGEKFTSGAIIAIVVFSIFIVLLLLGTLYDILYYRKLSDEEKRPNFLIAFSVVTNGRKLLSTSTSKNSLKCLDGLRVVSMMWVVVGHSFQFTFITAHTNTKRILDWMEEMDNVFVVSTSMAVDTFFTISGLLVSYLFLKGQSKGVRFSLPMFYVHRILRLTPSLVMMVLLTTTLFTHMGSGPFWPAVKELCQKPCEKNWWATLLYLQNYFSPDDQCLGQAWYLAADTQMFILSPLVFFPLMKWPKQTIGAIVVFIALNCGYVFEITWKKHLGTTFLNQNNLTYQSIYAPSHVRGTVYLIGIVCGYIIHKCKADTSLKLTENKVKITWILSLLMMTLIALAHSAMVGAKNYEVLNSSLFNSLTRVGWALALSIIILLCVHGYGGPINSFLSCKVFTLLYRLNYSVYLLHLNIIVSLIAQKRAPTYFSPMTTYHEFWGNYMFTIGASIIWTLAFELPVITIEKIILGTGQNSKKIGKTNI